MSIKKCIVLISSGIWIYYRTNECYYMLERKNFKVVIMTMIWTYLFMKEPLVLPIGLSMLALFRKK